MNCAYGTVQGHIDTSSQKLAVAKAVNYAVPAEVAFVLELHPQPASASPAFMLAVLEKTCECGDMELALRLLEENSQLAAENRHVYKLLLGHLWPLHGESPREPLNLCCACLLRLAHLLTFEGCLAEEIDVCHSMQ